MPSGPRILANDVQGVTTDNPLLVGATTMNSAGLANLPVVSSAHAVLVLDPLRVNGAPEIVVVTAHSASATSATITRGAYGTTARQHPSGTVWAHAPTIDDVVRILTSSTRPADPYQGQLIYETDTDSYVGYAAGGAWRTAVPLGAWTAYTPTLTATTTNPTLGTGVVNVGRYMRIGRRIEGYIEITFGTGMTAGSGTYLLALPVAPALIGGAGGYQLLGIMKGYNAGSNLNALLQQNGTATQSRMVYSATWPSGLETTVQHNVPWTWAAAAVIQCRFSYEAAS